MRPKLQFLKINLFVICLLMANMAYSQCPDFAYISANTKCIFLTWNTIPGALPTTITYNSVTYGYLSGSGATADAAIYRDTAPGSGACNANQSLILTGVVYIPEPCAYLNGVLPLNLVSFEGQKINNLNHLKWQTSLEKNTNLFEVESSVNGQKFEKIGTVQSKNNNSNEVNEYSFIDATISDQPIYYRLKSIDMDGATSNSKVIAIKGIDDFNKIKAFPSPTTGVVNINVISESNIGTMAKLLDLSGKQIMSFPVTKKILPIDLQQLNKGLYVVRFNNGEFVKIIKE
ncbi:MAG: T9SS type A sorting domain-containing protein [Bacteroidota bacterium]